jgi:hypothetical protein
MPEDIKNSDFLEELTKLVTQISEHFHTPGSGCCPPEVPGKTALAAEIMTVLSAALAATASKTVVWCKNINQNGVANNSFINPDYKINLENDLVKKSDETAIITVDTFKSKPKKETPLEEMELELLEL